MDLNEQMPKNEAAVNGYERMLSKAKLKGVDIGRRIMEKIVEFTWCNSCKHKEKEEYEDPCHECLNEPGREDSRRPLYFESAES